MRIPSLEFGLNGRDLRASFSARRQQSDAQAGDLRIFPLETGFGLYSVGNLPIQSLDQHVASREPLH